MLANVPGSGLSSVAYQKRGSGQVRDKMIRLQHAIQGSNTIKTRPTALDEATLTSHFSHKFFTIPLICDYVLHLVCHIFIISLRCGPLRHLARCSILVPGCSRCRLHFIEGCNWCQESYRQLCKAPSNNSANSESDCRPMFPCVGAKAL